MRQGCASQVRGLTAFLVHCSLESESEFVTFKVEFNSIIQEHTASDQHDFPRKAWDVGVWAERLRIGHFEGEFLPTELGLVVNAESLYLTFGSRDSAIEGGNFFSQVKPKIRLGIALLAKPLETLPSNTS